MEERRVPTKTKVENLIATHKGDASAHHTKYTHPTTGTCPQAPKAHKASHEPGGGDPMTVDAAVATGSLRTLGTGAQQAAAGNHTHTLVITEEWAPLDRTTIAAEWETADETVVSSARKIAVWIHPVVYRYTMDYQYGYIRILVDDVEKISVYQSCRSDYSRPPRWGPGIHYGGVGGTVKCQVKAGVATAASGGRRGMYSVGV